jgi:hypothetical protein
MGVRNGKEPVAILSEAMFPGRDVYCLARPAVLWPSFLMG